MCTYFKAFSFRGTFPLARGSARGPGWRLRPHSPAICSRSMLIMSQSPCPYLKKFLYGRPWHHYVHWRKDITVTTPKNPQNDWLYAHSSTKKKDVVIKRTHINVRLLVASVGEYNKWVFITPAWHFSITETWLLRNTNRNMMLSGSLQQFLCAIRQR